MAACVVGLGAGAFSARDGALSGRPHVQFWTQAALAVLRQRGVQAAVAREGWQQEAKLVLAVVVCGHGEVAAGNGVREFYRAVGRTSTNDSIEPSANTTPWASKASMLVWLCAAWASRRAASRWLRCS